ncbi:hypothetical protein ACS0TY_020319 [Phlomoides rotata]
MELKHFSHAHPLTSHHVPRGSEIQCSACHTPGSGDVYVCWQCNFFLHQICFIAKRSLKHPTHPLHPLTLVPSPTYPSGSFICNSCSLDGHGLSYFCSECEFDVHIHCILFPTPNPHPHASSSLVPAPSFSPHKYNSQPQIPIATTPKDPPPPPGVSPVYPQPNTTTPPTPVESNEPKSETSMIKHFSHPHFLKPNEIEQKLDCSACESDLSGSAYSCTEPHCNFNLHKDCFDLPREVSHKFHPLTLLAAPAGPTYTDGFKCDACWENGKAFVYNCAACSFDLHVDCVRLPEKVSRPDHEHPLSLSTPFSERVLCDVCMNIVNENVWWYSCSECDIATHLECVHSEVQQRNVTVSRHEEDMGDITDQLLRMQQQQTQDHIRIQMMQQNDMFLARQNALFMKRMINPWTIHW